ncbi:MAG: hypothetical protein E6614_16740 [Bradyrhizobium sp.]|uniref:hypothetical protein n=2 Tax=Bradyrhizobium sp. TaxID=376 RepID=UPI0029053E69|nr:hypothetical protein [Bradyrhizobium sp.]MDU0954541.1 hypothetical protein [Bradyrhizobium sp.]MDU2925798.1 hypothetical protein [Bradyrhizobium sp.]MDU3041932.1 hypothetical protein [Bradyrhizobium sp.]MDU3133118.1 hypothetical protein [Bradyrhizobium sp.]MDU6240587.1 hypothetical protein [Bradyrhizobium sp.]
MILINERSKEMERALERACALKPELFVQHEWRSFVAQRLMEAARGKSLPLDDLTEVGRKAVVDLASQIVQRRT